MAHLSSVEVFGMEYVGENMSLNVLLDMRFGGELFFRHQ